MDFMLLFGPAITLLILVLSANWNEARPRRPRRLTRYKSPVSLTTDGTPAGS